MAETRLPTAPFTVCHLPFLRHSACSHISVFLLLLFSAGLVHLFTKYLLNTCCVPSTMPGTKERTINNRLFIPLRSSQTNGGREPTSELIIMNSSCQSRLRSLATSFKRLFPPPFWSSRTDHSLRVVLFPRCWSNAPHTGGVRRMDLLWLMSSSGK